MGFLFFFLNRELEKSHVFKNCIYLNHCFKLIFKLPKLLSWGSYTVVQSCELELWTVKLAHNGEKLPSSKEKSGS